MEDKILRRILRELDCRELWPALAERLSLSDLQSLLLAVYRHRTRSLTAAEVGKRYEENRFVQPSGVPPQVLADIDRVAFGLVPEPCHRLELSPLAPLGTVGSMGKLSQDLAITTIRNSEVCSDLFV